MVFKALKVVTSVDQSFGMVTRARCIVLTWDSTNGRVISILTLDVEIKFM